MSKIRSQVSNLKDIKALLKKNSGELKRLKISKISIFGSFARGEQTSKSDIDVLVEFSVPVGFFHFCDVQTFLASLFGRKIDLVTDDGLRPEMRNQIYGELVRAS